jgi:hypothetical protein
MSPYQDPTMDQQYCVQQDMITLEHIDMWQQQNHFCLEYGFFFQTQCSLSFKINHTKILFPTYTKLLRLDYSERAIAQVHIISCSNTMQQSVQQITHLISAKRLKIVVSILLENRSLRCS